MVDQVDERSFPADVRQIAAARAFATAAAGLGGLVGDAVALVTSELATNAVVHAGSAFTVRVLRRPGQVRVEVFDRDSTLPAVRDDRDRGPTGGQGLAIVRSLTRRWGADAVDDGKWVWAELDAPD